MSEFHRTRYKTFNLVKTLREEKGLSQRQLAEIVGLSRNVLASIERYEAEPSYRTAYCISRYFGRPVEEVFIIQKIM